MSKTDYPLIVPVTLLRMFEKVQIKIADQIETGCRCVLAFPFPPFTSSHKKGSEVIFA